MNQKTILFATDFSTPADAALEHATSLAQGMGAKLIILHVAEPGVFYGMGEMYYGVPEPDESELRAMLAELKPSDSRVKYEHRLAHGSPAAEIVHQAEESGAAMIVMGTHGRSGLGRLLMGSVAEAVLRRSPCPVLTVKCPPAPHPVVE